MTFSLWICRTPTASSCSARRPRSTSSWLERPQTAAALTVTCSVRLQQGNRFFDIRLMRKRYAGLKKLLQDGEELPKIYQDPTFAQSSNWILSTSQLSSEYFDGWGYGPVTDGGYGLAYSVNERTLRFTITSENRSQHNNVQAFRHYLEEACEDVREVMEKAGAAQPEPVKAKL